MNTAKFMPRNEGPQEVEFVAEKEGMNVYRLEDGTVLRVRLITMRIDRDGWNEDGSPRYLLKFQQVIDGKYPPNLLRDKSCN